MIIKVFKLIIGGIFRGIGSLLTYMDYALPMDKKGGMNMISECVCCGAIMDYDPKLYEEGETGEAFCDDCKEKGCDKCD